MLSAPLTAQGPIDTAADLVDRLAWDIALAVAPPPARTRDELFAQRDGVPFEAAKTHAEGLAARGPAARDPRPCAARSPSPRPSTPRASPSAGCSSSSASSRPPTRRLAAFPPSRRSGARARFLQGVALLEVGRYREAAPSTPTLAAAARPPPRCSTTRRWPCCATATAATRAADVLRQAVALSPDSLDIAFNLGWALIVEGEPDGAAFVLRDLTTRAPLDRHARLLLAWALGLAGRAAEQAEEWKAVAALAPGFRDADPPRPHAAVRAHPSHPSGPSRRRRTPAPAAELAASLLARAQRLYDSGDPEGAMKEATRSAYLDPDNRRTHLLMARLHRLRGDHERALNEFRIFLWSNDDAGRARRGGSAPPGDGAGAGGARSRPKGRSKLDPDNEQARRVLETPD